jgi:hypothetical protein
MSGLSSQAILNMLAAEGTTAVTKSLILDFLNAAQSANDIAGVEHQEGPVVDDPSRGYGDQVADYDIGVVVARRIIARRSALGGFSDLTQLDGIRGFGPDKFHDLLYSFARTVYEVSAIIFNYNTAAITNDALNLRKNAATAGPSPAWQKGVSSTYSDSPALYAIKETQGNPLAIRVSFRANGISGAFIRAVGGGRLGSPKERYISFDSGGYSGYETFELQNPTFHAHGVNAYNIAWKWQFRLRVTDPWRSILTTRHRIFVVLNAPTLPWVQTVGSTSLPWTDGLEIACNWAQGATDRVTAAARITAGYNGSGRVSYDTVSGATFYGFASYNLTQMIDRLNGGAGLGAKVNCTDSADTVATLANLVGCDLWESRMSSSFDLNPMIAIGYNTWAIPFSGSFSYHEVAWTGACTANDRVFDGCLKVDADADPTTAPHTALLPTDMLFGDCTTMNYRLRLCPPTATGCARCQPQPATTRQRRPIV